MTISEFIKKRSHLIWYTKEYDKLSKEAIVEAVLNYGDWDDVQQLIKIIGIKKVAEIFRKQTGGFRTNYRLEVSNYFRLYFNKHAR
jgi:hypothetical protein